MKTMLRLVPFIILLAALPSAAIPIAITQNPFEVMRSGDDLVLAFNDRQGIRKKYEDLESKLKLHAALKDGKTVRFDYAGNHVWFVENFFFGFNRYDSESRMRFVAKVLNGNYRVKPGTWPDFDKMPPWYVSQQQYQSELQRFDPEKGEFIRVSALRRAWERFCDCRPQPLDPFHREFLPDEY